MSQVALVRCESYDQKDVRRAVERGIGLLGGLSKFVLPNEKILLKPNWLSADPPEKGVTTHPAVVKAVAEIFKENGAKVSYGDSPAFQSPASAAERTGTAKVAGDLDIPLGDFTAGKEVPFAQGRQNKKFMLANAMMACDGVISLPKMKTHGFMKITGAVKNQFGCIPGATKSEFHIKVPNAVDFARMLVDLNMLIRPRLFIMDGIQAMEGNGPRGGKVKKMNVILLSADPVALDATFCRLITLNPEYVLTNVAGKEYGLGTYKEEEIELLGDPIESFVAAGFDVDRDPIKPYKPSKGLGFAKNALVPKPYILSEKCVRCGVCVSMCPVNPKAVDWHDGDKSHPPTYKYDRCIRCYCCQELCPESAIQLKKPVLRRLFSKKST